MMARGAGCTTSAVQPPASDLVTCVAAYRRCNRAEYELEARLGNYVHGKFYPGISKDVFEQLERDLHDAPSLSTDNKWNEIVDFHYVNQRGEPSRTRVEYDTEQMVVRTEHTCKRAQQHCIYGRTEDGDEACKIALSAEIPSVDPPGSCLPTHVRIKQRKCFLDVRDGDVIWSYELSKTWSGNNRSAVEHAQHVSEPIYEVECELVDRGDRYMDTRTDVDIATSLLMKAKLLLGEEPTTDLELITSVVTDGTPGGDALAKPVTAKRRRR